MHLSASQVSRRIARLDETDIDRAYCARLDPELLGLDVEACTLVSLDRHDLNFGKVFEEGIQDFDESLDCLSVTSEADYMLRIVAPGLTAFAAFLADRLMKLSGVKMVRSNIGVRRIKSASALPLNYLTRPAAKRQQVRYCEGLTFIRYRLRRYL